MMERRFRVWRKGKLDEVGKLDRKMQSSTMAKLGGGTRTASLSSPFSTSTINPIVGCSKPQCVCLNLSRKYERLDFY